MRCEHVRELIDTAGNGHVAGNVGGSEEHRSEPAELGQRSMNVAMSASQSFELLISRGIRTLKRNDSGLRPANCTVSGRMAIENGVQLDRADTVVSSQ